jgi:hypothetical protein
MVASVVDDGIGVAVDGDTVMAGAGEFTIAAGVVQA